MGAWKFQMYFSPSTHVLFSMYIMFEYQLYLLSGLTLTSIDLLSRRVWLWALHVHVPLNVPLTFLRINICFSFSVSPIWLPLQCQDTLAGGLPSSPSHRHMMSSPLSTMVVLEQLIVTVGFSEMQ